MAAEIFGVDGLIILFLLLVPLSFGLALWALIDAATAKPVIPAPGRGGRGGSGRGASGFSGGRGVITPAIVPPTVKQ